MNQNTINILKKQVEIPEIVTNSAQEAYKKIYQEIEMPEHFSQRTDTASFWRVHHFAACLMVGILAIGGITAGAAVYHQWSKGLTEIMQVQEEEKPDLEETGVADFLEQAVTIDGVTVTAKQTIVDNYNAYISFKVEGYELAETEEPGFGSVKVSVGGRDTSILGGGFYDGLVTGPYGLVVLEDGSPVPKDENGKLIVSYEMEDGSLEYHLSLFSEEKGSFLNQPIHVKLSDLGVFEKTDFTAKRQGDWEFDWTLQGTDDVYSTKCQGTLGDTGATLIAAEISPISIKTVIQSNPATSKEPPALIGVKLKDGTFYPYVTSGGQRSYDAKQGQYEFIGGTERILDVEQVESLLFLKSAPKIGEEELAEENCYEVKIR